MRAIGVAMLTLLTLGGTAQAQRFSNLTGGRLGNLCISKGQASREACEAYLDGISDAASFYQRLMPADGSRGGKFPEYICVPGPTTGGQLRESFVSWLRKHPDMQRQTAARAAVQALNDTYLCSDEQKKP